MANCVGSMGHDQYGIRDGKIEMQILNVEMQLP